MTLKLNKYAAENKWFASCARGVPLVKKLLGAVAQKLLLFQFGILKSGGFLQAGAGEQIKFNTLRNFSRENPATQKSKQNKIKTDLEERTQPAPNQ
jgi:hypothetical protein